jgi:hypothetical protein
VFTRFALTAGLLAHVGIYAACFLFGRPTAVTLWLLALVSLVYVAALTASIKWSHRLKTEFRALRRIEAHLSHDTAVTEDVTSDRGWAAAAVRILPNTSSEESRATAAAIVLQADTDVELYSSLIRYCSGAVVLCGVLATFIGMTQIVVSLVHTNTPAAVLKAAATGLRTAFPVTIAGIISSLFINLGYYAVRARHRVVTVELRKFIEFKILAELSDLRLDTIAQIVERTLNRALPQLVAESAKALKDTAAGIAQTTAQLVAASENFGQAAALLAASSAAIDTAHANELDNFLRMSRTVDEIHSGVRSASASLQSVNASGQVRHDEILKHLRLLAKSAEELLSRIRRGSYESPIATSPITISPPTLWEQIRERLGL